MIQAIYLLTDYIKNSAAREYINTRGELLKF
jgi:hypothetical protein